MDCVICGEVIGADNHGWVGGANAEPVAEGQCCWKCDETVVLPRRIEDIMRESRLNFRRRYRIGSRDRMDIYSKGDS